ncbi:class I SAM-dependent methyltransferase, partial [Priestia megaterium]|uniref:class I SAM-dependent methyltransferase n=1 Tax=Priestia megaterium TaxID=1404 RepID=UPI002FFF2B1D
PSPGDRILEIGMGTGATLNRLLNEYEDIEKICGIDISLSMVNKAKQVNRGFIANHKAEITEGNVEHIPFAACVTCSSRKEFPV